MFVDKAATSPHNWRMMAMRTVRNISVAIILGLIPDGARAQQPFARQMSPAHVLRQFTLAFDSGHVERARRDLGRGVAASEGGRFTLLLDATEHRLQNRRTPALALYRTLANDSLHRLAPYALAGAASIIGQQGGYASMADTLAKAARLLSRAADTIGLTEVLAARTLAILRVHGVDSARAVLGAATSILPRQDRWLRARLLCVRAQVDVRGGRRITDSTWDTITAQASALGPRLASQCLFMRAQYIQTQGLGAAAVALLDTVAEMQERAALWADLAASRQWQGSTLVDLGRYREARGYLTASREASRRAGGIAGNDGWVALAEANISRHLGAHGDAASWLTTARRLLSENQDATGLSFVDRGEVELLHLHGNLEDADAGWRRLVARDEGLVPLQVVPALIARSDLARRRGALDEAGLLLDSASRLIDERNLPGWRTEWRYARGLQALSMGRPEVAVAHFDTLLSTQRRLLAPRRFEVVMRWAEAQTQMQRFDRAWRAFESDSRLFDRWRRGFVDRVQALASLGDRQFDWDRDLGLATMIARFAEAGRTAEALTMAEWRRLRSAEQAVLQQGALRVQVEDDRQARAVVLQAVDSIRLDRARLTALARGRLTANTAVIAYVTGQGDEPTTAFVLTRDTLRAVVLTPIDSLREPMRRLSAFLRAGTVPTPLVADVSRRLTLPVLALLPNTVRRVVIVPDGELHRLPFVALHDVRGEPLIATFDIAVAPSVELALGGTSSVARRPSTRSAAIGAPATMPIDAATGVPWGSLPGARREVRAVSSLLADVERLEGRRATQQNIDGVLARGGRILHIATHAISDPASIGNNGLVVERTAANDGFLSLTELGQRPLPFDLVVLSACSSGDGLLLTGQGLNGLVSTALDAGARGAIATRWALNDTAIVPYVLEFYRRLRAGHDVVHVLSDVQREAYRSGASPAVWANLEYVGDPTLTVLLPDDRGWWGRSLRSITRWWNSVSSL
jgi:tetratricopeptide (TPR) repeat protein